MENTRNLCTEPGVGNARRDLYASVIDHYHNCIKDGYYVEAIAIMESLMADRAWSLAEELGGTKNYEFFTLAQIAHELKDKNPNGFTDIIDNIIEWQKSRNRAVHSIAKNASASEADTFDHRYSVCKQVAEQGFELFKTFDSALKKYRR